MVSVPQFLDERLTHWAHTTPESLAFTYLGRSWTWEQWNERVRRCAGALAALGIGRGDVVAFLDKNHPACIEVTIAAATLGAATTIVNVRLAPEETAYVLSDCRATVLVVGSDLAAALPEQLDMEHIIEVTPDGHAGDPYEAMLAAATPVGRTFESQPDDVVLILYSSGTTGRPKGVALTHFNVISHTTNGFDGWQVSGEDTNLVAMPLFHVAGTSYAQLGIHCGIPSVITRDVDNASLASAIAAGATRAFLVPAVLAMVLDSGPEAVKTFAALKTYAYGASPMPMPLLRRALHAWPETDFIQAYGLTEVCGVVSRLMPEDHRTADPERLASAGTLVPNAEARIVDPNTLTDVADGTQGEIWLRTTQLMKGYLHNHAATAEAITADGWFRTGDIGRIDAEGYLFVEDRLKDMIITGGENVYSIEVERALAEHPAVAEVAVVGVPDPKWGEAVKAVVALTDRVSEESLITFARQRLAAYKCPKTVDIVDALPRNATGKIDKRDLRSPYWQNSTP